MKKLYYFKYNEYHYLADNVDYSLKKIMLLGLIIQDILGFIRIPLLNRNLKWMLVEIHGGHDVDKYIRLHNAFKIVYLLVGCLISIFFALIIAESDAVFFGICMLIIVFLAFLPDYELQKMIKTRRLLLQAEFPDFLNKITLLLGAGMTVTRAWEKIVRESEKNSPLNKELSKSMFDIQAGKSILQSYEGFARRCRIPEINKFVTLILQNIKKGNAELVLILSVQATECWEMRKLAVRKMGEELSTKLLFPLFLMLVAIILIVAAPAILAIMGI